MSTSYSYTNEKVSNDTLPESERQSSLKSPSSPVKDHVNKPSTLQILKNLAMDRDPYALPAPTDTAINPSSASTVAGCVGCRAPDCVGCGPGYTSSGVGSQSYASSTVGNYPSDFSSAGYTGIAAGAPLPGYAGSNVAGSGTGVANEAGIAGTFVPGTEFGTCEGSREFVTGATPLARVANLGHPGTTGDINVKMAQMREAAAEKEREMELQKDRETERDRETTEAGSNSSVAGSSFGLGSTGVASSAGVSGAGGDSYTRESESYMASNTGLSGSSDIAPANTYGGSAVESGVLGASSMERGMEDANIGGSSADIDTSHTLRPSDFKNSDIDIHDIGSSELQNDNVGSGSYASSNVASGSFAGGVDSTGLQNDNFGSSVGSSTVGASSFDGSSLGTSNLGSSSYDSSNIGGGAGFGSSELQNDNLGSSSLRDSNIGGSSYDSSNIGSSSFGGAGFGSSELQNDNLGSSNIGGSSLATSDLGNASSDLGSSSIGGGMGGSGLHHRSGLHHSSDIDSSNIGGSSFSNNDFREGNVESGRDLSTQLSDLQVSGTGMQGSSGIQESGIQDSSAQQSDDQTKPGVWV